MKSSIKEQRFDIDESNWLMIEYKTSECGGIDWYSVIIRRYDTSGFCGALDGDAAACLKYFVDHEGLGIGSNDWPFNVQEQKSRVYKPIQEFLGKFAWQLRYGKGIRPRYSRQHETISRVPIKSSDPSIPVPVDYVPIRDTACVLKSTRILENKNRVYVLDDKRRQLYKDINNTFAQGYNVVFLCGFGGTGKSTFAKRYALDRLKDGTYTTVVFAPIDVKRGNINLQSLICDDSVFTITSFPKRGEKVSIDSHGVVECINESVEEYFTRKLAKLREICDNKTLIIIDNFDVE